jgi:MFS family permease
MGSNPAKVFLNQADKPTGKHFLILAMSWAGWLFDFYDLMLFSFLVIPIKHSLDLSDSSLSLLVGTSLGATALGGIVFGWLADKFGRKRVLSWTILVYSFGALMCGFATDAVSLALCRVITGFGVGGEWATGQTLVGETFPARMRGRFAAVMQTGAPLGIAAAAVVGGFVEPMLANTFGPDWGWRGCFFISFVPALLVVFIRRYMPESDVWLERKRQAAPKESGQIRYLLTTPEVRRLFLLGLILATTDMSAYWFTYSWMPRYLYEQLGSSLGKAGIWMLVTQTGGTLGYLSFGIVADWKGRRVAYTIYSFIWALALFAVTWFWDALAAYPATAILFMFLVGLGTGNFSGYGPIFSEIFPTRVRNTAMGTAFNLARGVQFFTPLVITVVATRYGLGGGISLAGVFALITGLWVWTLPETRGRRIGVDVA